MNNQRVLTRRNVPLRKGPSRSATQKDICRAEKIIAALSNGNPSKADSLTFSSNERVIVYAAVEMSISHPEKDETLFLWKIVEGLIEQTNVINDHTLAMIERHGSEYLKDYVRARLSAR